jgi:hypothetical protein
LVICNRKNGDIKFETNASAALDFVTADEHLTTSTTTTNDETTTTKDETTRAATRGIKTRFVVFRHK